MLRGMVLFLRLRGDMFLRVRRQGLFYVIVCRVFVRYRNIDVFLLVVFVVSGNIFLYLLCMLAEGERGLLVIFLRFL